jgi:hypothetical protein
VAISHPLHPQGITVLLINHNVVLYLINVFLDASKIEKKT